MEKLGKVTIIIFYYIEKKMEIIEYGGKKTKKKSWLATRMMFERQKKL
jgi:hypothetical protein